MSNTYCVEDPENLSELFAYSLPVTALGSSRVAILDYFYQLHFIDKFNGVLEEELMIATGIHLENIQQIIGTLSAESILEFVQKNWRLQRTPVAVQAAKEAFEKYQSISRNPEQEKRSMTQDPKKVFIVHGWNDAAVKATQQFLQSVGLHSDPFETVRSKMSGTVSIPTIIRKAFEEAQAIIVLWTPDEWVDSRPSIRDAEMKDKSNGRWQPRPNVLIEAGAAILKETDRTILLGVGLQDAPSDFAGLHLFRMNNAAPQRQRLLNMLKASGCEVNPTNENYLDSRLGGDFETCVSTATLPEVNGEVTFHNH